MRRALKTAVCILALALGATEARAQTDPAVRARQGKQALADGRFDEAARIYGELVERIPGNPGLFLNQGMALHLAGRDREALAALSAALEIDSNIFPALLFSGASRLRLGETEAAIAPLEKAVALVPDHLDARRMLGDAYVLLDRPEQALPHFKKLMAAASEDPAAWTALLQTYETLAGQAFDELERTAPESAYMLRLVGELRLQQKQLPSAFTLFREAAERDPSMRGLHAALAEIYGLSDHPDWAAEELRKERELGELDCSEAGWECDFAAGRYERVVVAADASPAGLFWKAKAYNQLAADVYEKLAALPDSAAKHEHLARVFEAQNRFDEAVEAWKQALAADPGRADYERAVAVQLYWAGRFDEALPRLRRLIEREPESAELNFFLGDALLARQQPEEAVAFLKKAVALPAARASLGRAYMLLDRPADAAPHLEAALDLDRDGSLHYQLAQAYQRTGRREEAREPLRRYQQLQKAQTERLEAAREMEISAP